MKNKTTFKPEELRYLQLLAKQYPTVQAACTELINLQAILNLPKGTEHFISDIHGEYEAFSHMLNACSGVVKEKLDEIFGTSLSRHDRDELATLIYTRRKSWRWWRRRRRTWTSGIASHCTVWWRCAAGCLGSIPAPR